MMEMSDYSKGELRAVVRQAEEHRACGGAQAGLGVLLRRRDKLSDQLEEAETRPGAPRRAVEITDLKALIAAIDEVIRDWQGARLVTRRAWEEG